LLVTRTELNDSRHVILDCILNNNTDGDWTLMHGCQVLIQKQNQRRVQRLQRDTSAHPRSCSTWRKVRQTSYCLLATTTTTTTIG